MRIQHHQPTLGIRLLINHACIGFAPSAASLGALSFRLHKELAEQYNGRKLWGYSESTGVSYTQGQDTDDAVGGSGEDWLSNGTSRAQAAGAKVGKGSPGPVWLKRTDGSSMEVISQDHSTGQLYVCT